jgi:hypothetical protein
MIEEFPNQPRQPRRFGCAQLLFALVVAFTLGAGAMGIGAWSNGWRPVGWPLPAVHSVPMPSPVATPTEAAPTEAGLAARIAALDQKLSRIDGEAKAAAGNAGRAEALLVAIATRRAIERGTPLGYLEGQLRLRFGEALPDVVETIIASTHNPVTLDRLTTRLQILSPQLIGPDEQTTWSRVQHDLSGLFVLHSNSGGLAPSPKVRLDHARLCLKEGRIEDAMADVRLLPGAKVAKDWLADARRFADVGHALDAIDTAALLEPKLLRDSSGKPIEQASPVAAPPVGTAPAAIAPR